MTPVGCFTIRALMVAAGVAALTSSLLAADISWGKEVDGLRIGVSRSTEGLSVFVDNKGLHTRAVLLGYEPGPSYYLGFSVTGMDGSEYEARYREERMEGPGGPIVVRLAPSQSHGVEFSFERFGVVKRGSNRFSPSTQRYKLEELIDQSAKVRVRFVVTPAMISERHYGYPEGIGNDAWTGDVTSGDLIGSQ